MKKIVLASLLALGITSANALEVGVIGSHEYGTDRNSAGVTVGEKFGPFNFTLGFDRTTANVNSQNRWSLVASYPLMKFGPVSTSVKAGAAYLDNSLGYDGGSALVGLGAEMPVWGKITGTVDFTHQHGQARVSQYNGNRITAGLKYSF